MDDENNNHDDSDYKFRKFKKKKTFGTEILYKKTTINDKRENSLIYSKRYNSSKRIIDISSNNSLIKSFQNDKKENIEIKSNKFISNSKIKVDDMKLKIANHKIQSYINNLIGAGFNNSNSEREFNTGANASLQHKRVESFRKYENRRNSKFSNRLSFPSMDLKNNVNNYMITLGQEDSSNKNLLSGFNKNYKFNNNFSNNDLNVNNLLNPPGNRNGIKNYNGKINNMFGEMNLSNDSNEHSDEHSNWKKKSFTSKCNDENEIYNVKSFLQLENNNNINNNLNSNKGLVDSDGKRLNSLKDLKLIIPSNLRERTNNSNLLLLNENLNIKNEENNNNININNDFNNKDFESSDHFDTKANFIKLKNQNTLNSLEKNFLGAENESYLRNNNNEKKNYFLGLHTHQKRSNINLINKKSEGEIKRNSSFGSNYPKNSKLLGYDLNAKNKLTPGNRNDSSSNNNFLLNKSLTNSNIMNANKNKDFSFESENLDREILNIHLKYSNNNFEEAVIKNNKKKGSRKSALLKEDQSKKFLVKLNQMNSHNNAVSPNNQLINLNNNISNKNEPNANLDTNNYILDSQSNLIPANENIRNIENSNSSKNNIFNSTNLVENNGSNRDQHNEETSNRINPTNKLNNPIQINIQSNLNTSNKNPNRNFDFDINNVRKSIQKNKFLDQENDDIDRRYSSENSTQDERSIKIYHNIYDSFSGEEWDEAKAHKPKYILRPDCSFKEIVDVLSTLFVFYTIIFSPYQMAFEKDDDIPDKNLLYFDISIDFFFVFDFLLNFITAYRDEKDDLIFSLSKIMKNYIKTWFIFDLISCVPFTFINFMIPNEAADPTTSRIILMDSSNKLGVTKLQRFAKIAKFYRLLKWSKILRFLKIAKSDNTAKNLFGSIDGLTSSVNRFLKFLILFVFLIHFATCIWIFVANMSISNGDPINWITYYNLMDQTNSQIYITSLYFIVVTVFSIGYGDITPKSFTEKLMSLILLTVGCLIFSYALSSLSNIFSQIDKKKEIYNKKESILNEIKLEYKLDRALENKIKNSLKHDLNSWNKDRLKLLDSLPSILKNQLYLKMYEVKIRNLIFFDSQSYEFITFTIGYLKSVKFSKNDYIISIGEIIYEMYLTITGYIGVELGTKYQKHEICMIPENFHFGDILMYTNQQSKLSYKVKTNHSELFILSKINFAQIKLAFDKPTSKLLEQSYEFFMKIERTRILAIRYFEKNGSFEDFRGYLKKYVNKKNMQFKHQYHLMALEQSEISLDKPYDSHLEYNRSSVNEDSVSDIFTINSRKTQLSEIVYAQEVHDARSNVSRSFNSKISKLTKNQKLKDDLSVRKNIPSLGNNNTRYITNNAYDDNCANFNLNKSIIADENIEDIFNSVKLANKKFEVTKDYFDPESFKENINKNGKDIKDKNSSTLFKKKTLFVNNKEPLEQINEDETVILKKSKTTKYTKKKTQEHDISSKIKRLITKEKNKESKQNDNKSVFDVSDHETNKNNNITLNYKGFNINSMCFSPGERKKLKFRYETLNLNISSDSSFFNSEKDEEKTKNFVNEATPLKKCKTSKFDQTYKNKASKNIKLLTTKDKTLERKNTTNDNRQYSSNKKDLSKSQFSSENKSEKEINIKNQLIRALTSTSKKDYNEDINNFYTFNYENNKESIKLKNLDKHFSKKSSNNKKNKISTYNNFTGNNTIKEKNSLKYSDEASKASDYLEYKKASGEQVENKDSTVNNAFTDLNHKENLNNNNNNIRSEISLLNSNNSKNIIYINNLNINYSNQNVNPMETMNNPGHFSINENNFIINNNDPQNSDILSLENRFSFNDINKLINSNNFINQDAQINREFVLKEHPNKDLKILNQLSNRKTNNFQNEIDNTNLTKPFDQIRSNVTKPINENNFNNKEANKNNKNSNLSNIANKSDKNYLSIKSDDKRKRNSILKNRNNNKDYNSDNIDIIKNLDNSNSEIRFKNIKINSSQRKKIKSEFHSESESKAQKSKRSNVEIRSPKNKKENNCKHNKYLNKNHKNDNLHTGNSQSVSKNINNIFHNPITSPFVRNSDYYESDANFFNRVEPKKKIVTAADKKSKTTKIFPKDNSKSSKSKSKSIFESNKGINFYGGNNVPFDSYGMNNNNKNNYSNNNALSNLRTNSNQNSYHLNSTMSRPNKSIPNKKLTSDTNISKNKTLKQYKSLFDGKPSLTVKRSANEVNYKNIFNQNLNNNNNSNSVSQLKFMKKKSFLEIPNKFNDKGEYDFLKVLSNKISYDAFLYKNKEVLQNCIKDFLDDIQGESRFKHIMNRLNNLELLVKEYVKNSNTIVNNRKKNSKKNYDKM